MSKLDRLDSTGRQQVADGYRTLGEGDPRPLASTIATVAIAALEVLGNPEADLDVRLSALWVYIGEHIAGGDDLASQLLAALS